MFGSEGCQQNSIPWNSNYNQI